MKKKTSIAGDWILTDIIMDAGESRAMEFKLDTKRELMDEASIYLNGRFELTNANGEHVAYREIGDFSAKRPDVPAGTYTMTALEPESRLLCFRPKIRGHLYKCDNVALGFGDSYTIEQGCDVLVARGSVAWGDKIRPAVSLIITETKDLTITAHGGPALLIELWRE